jgi:hypothetical protein
MNDITRREFFGHNVTGLAALASLLGLPNEANSATQALAGLPHFKPTAKRVIYLFQSGGPSQMELFDYKPELVRLQGTDLPASVRMGQRLTTMSSAQAKFPVVPSKYKFAQHGKSGAWVSELLPHTARPSITTRRSRFFKPDHRSRGVQVWVPGCPMVSGPRRRTCPRSW